MAAVLKRARDGDGGGLPAHFEPNFKKRRTEKQMLKQLVRHTTGLQAVCDRLQERIAVLEKSDRARFALAAFGRPALLLPPPLPSPVALDPRGCLGQTRRILFSRAPEDATTLLYAAHTCPIGTFDNLFANVCAEEEAASGVSFVEAVELCLALQQARHILDKTGSAEVVPPPLMSFLEPVRQAVVARQLLHTAATAPAILLIIYSILGHPRPSERRDLCERLSDHLFFHARAAPVPASVSASASACVAPAPVATPAAAIVAAILKLDTARASASADIEPLQGAVRVLLREISTERPTVVSAGLLERLEEYTHDADCTVHAGAEDSALARLLRRPAAAAEAEADADADVDAAATIV